MHGRGEPWRLYGGARFHDGALDLGFLVGITDLAGEVAFDERRVDVRNLTGSLGGGDFLVEGTVGLDEGWNVGWAVSATLSGIIIQRVGYEVPFTITAVLYAVAASTFYLSFRGAPEGGPRPLAEPAEGRPCEGPLAE